LRSMAHLIHEPLDWFLFGDCIKIARPNTATNLVRRQRKWTFPSLNLVSQEFKSMLDIYNPCFLRMQLNPQFDQNLLRRV
jgi:hypothetical protein